MCVCLLQSGGGRCCVRLSDCLSFGPTGTKKSAVISYYPSFRLNYNFEFLENNNRLKTKLLSHGRRRTRVQLTVVS